MTGRIIKRKTINSDQRREKKKRVQVKENDLYYIGPNIWHMLSVPVWWVPGCPQGLGLAVNIVGT